MLDRDRDICEHFAAILLDTHSGDARSDQAYTQLSDELIRNVPRRGWITPDGKIESVEAVAIDLWIQHVRTIRSERDARAAATAASVLLTWWDALDTDGAGRDAVRIIAQELRPLRERGVPTIDRVREAHRLARAWGFAPPPIGI